MRRRFNGSERVELYLRAEGRCAGCGCELAPGWHADHRTPYARGGETALENGQALCVDCNLRKGASVREVSLWPEGMKRREWAERAFRRYLQSDGGDFLCMATPGAGKTLFALSVAHSHLLEGSAARVVVVVPTEHLKRQWKKAAKRVGLELNSSWSNAATAEASDYHGVIVTYQQVAQAPTLHAFHCGNRPTFVIFDEIHHAGESFSWGYGLRVAFEAAVGRLSLSGTPFRSDNSRIPFVNYQDGASSPDFRYGYGDALRDGVCAPVLFPSFEGRMEWFSRGEAFSATFGDELSEREASERLRTALSPACEWLGTAIDEAHAQLSELRKGEHPRAGGLVIAMTQEHARDIKRQVFDARCIAAVVVSSDDPDASLKIDAFEKSDDPWLIAVKMVSEGVDIPRLRVAVYATNILTELYFRQAVGRLVRVIDGLEDQSRFFFFPKDPVLVTYALRVKEERNHELMEELRQERERTLQLEEHGPALSGFCPETTSPAYPDHVYFDQEGFSPAELQEATILGREAGISSPAALLARVIRKVRGDIPAAAPAPRVPASDEKPLEDRKRDLTRIIKRLVAQLNIVARVEHKIIYARMNQLQNISSQQVATEEQLRERVFELQRLLKEHGALE